MSLRLRLSRIGRWPRLAAAAACLLLAGVSALESRAAPSTKAATRIVVAARLLPAGHALVPGDLTTAAVTGEPGGIRQPSRLVGRRLAGPVARGEPVTTFRLVDAGLTSGLRPGTVAMPIDVTTDVRGLVSPGHRVDLLAVRSADAADADTAQTASAQRLAERVLVLAALPPDTSATAAGCRLVLALDRDDALRIAGARSTQLFQVVALPP